MNLKDKNIYTDTLEQMTIQTLREIAESLCHSMSKNRTKFTFISQRLCFTAVGMQNKDSKAIDKTIKKQTTICNALIKKLETLDGMPLSDYAKFNINEFVMPLKDFALEFGYNEQAEALLKIAKNESLVGAAALSTDITKDILKVLDNYGKRMIYEGNPNIKDSADKLIVDVLSGEYGKDTRKTLDVDKMESAYSGATVRHYDTIISVDGTHTIAKDKV